MVFVATRCRARTKVCSLIKLPRGLHQRGQLIQMVDNCWPCTTPCLPPTHSHARTRPRPLVSVQWVFFYPLILVFTLIIFLLYFSFTLNFTVKSINSMIFYFSLKFCIIFNSTLKQINSLILSLSFIILYFYLKLYNKISKFLDSLIFAL